MTNILIEELVKSVDFTTTEKKKIEKIKFPELRECRKFKARKHATKKVYGF